MLPDLSALVLDTSVQPGPGGYAMETDEGANFVFHLQMLPVDIQRKIMITSIIDDKETSPCQRVDQLCNGDNQSRLKQYCNSPFFYIQLCEALEWFGPFGNWTTFFNAAVQVPSSVYHINEHKRPIALSTQFGVENPARIPKQWFGYMCTQIARFDKLDSGPIWSIWENEEFANYFNLNRKTEWIPLFTQLLNSTDVLLHAVASSSITSVRQILAVQGIDVNKRDRDGDTALIFASRVGHHETVKLLLAAAGIDVNKRDIQHGRTALTFASQRGHHETVKLLLAAAGIDVNSSDNYSDTALIFASRFGYSETVKLLLAAAGIDVNKRDIQYGRTALTLASQRGHHETVKLLLAAAGIDVNERDIEFGRTALTFASKRGHTETVKLLLAAAGIDVNKGDNDGSTPLIVASDRGDPTETVELLLAAAGIVVNKGDNDGRTALIVASRRGHPETVKLLLAAAGIDVNKGDNNGTTALIFASTYGHHETLKLLLAAAGIDVNKGDTEYGSTALTLASGRVYPPRDS